MLTSATRTDQLKFSELMLKHDVKNDELIQKLLLTLTLHRRSLACLTLNFSVLIEMLKNKSMGKSLICINLTHQNYHGKSSQTITVETALMPIHLDLQMHSSVSDPNRCFDYLPIVTMHSSRSHPVQCIISAGLNPSWFFLHGIVLCYTAFILAGFYTQP